MQRWRYFLSIVLALAALAGCRTAPFVNSHIETVNAEYRQLEDYVYGLEDENARLEQELEILRGNRASGTNTQPSGGGSGGLFRRRPPSAASGDGDPALNPPVIEVPDVPSETPPRRSTLNKPPVAEPEQKLDLEPPTIELPAPATPATPVTPKAAAPEQLPTPPADSKVTHLFLNPVMTGGVNLDSQPGDDGLSVVIEPRNAADEYVPLAGAVSVVVLDPSKAGEAARIAKWSFDLSATRQKLQTSSATRGIQFQMPWPATAPAASTLHLFVRFETPDGRRLQTDREIFLAEPGQLSQRWTPRQAERQRSAESVASATTDQPLASAPQPTTAQPLPVAAPKLLVPPAWSPDR